MHTLNFERRKKYVSVHNMGRYHEENALGYQEMHSTAPHRDGSGVWKLVHIFNNSCRLWPIHRARWKGKNILEMDYNEAEKENVNLNLMAATMNASHCLFSR